MSILLQNFLIDGNPRKATLLGVSSMVQTFCEANKECFKMEEIKFIIAQYERLLNTNCYAHGQEEEDIVIVALMGLRNIGHISHSFPVLEQCYMDYTNAVAIRLAALDTIKALRMPTFQPTLKKTFLNTTLDSEIRIGAYLALMNSADENLMTWIKDVFVNEPVNQGIYA